MRNSFTGSTHRLLYNDQAIVQYVREVSLNLLDGVGSRPRWA